MSLHKQIYTNTGGEPLVLLHGWGWHSGIWQPLLPELNRRYEIILLDLPGFGLSPGLQQSQYNLDYLTELLIAAAPEKAHWLGWSLGGLLATAVALRYPARIKSLINVTSSPCFVAEQTWPGMQAATLQRFAAMLRDDHQKTLQDFLLLQLHGSSNARPLFRQLRADVLSKHPPDIANLEYSLQLLCESDLRSQLTELSSPTLYIYGCLDALVPAASASVMQQLLPQAQYAIIEHASHMPFLSHQEEFLGLLGNFLKNNCRAD